MGNRLARTLVAFGMCLLGAACGDNGTKTALSPSRPTTTSSTTIPTTSSTATTRPPATTVPVPPDQGSWSLVPASTTSLGQPIAWTGTEVLAAKSACCDDLGSVQLSAYDPTTNTWHELPHTPLTPRDGAAGAWTGTEMVIAGGYAGADGNASHATNVTDGAAWNAQTNTWHPIAPMPTALIGSRTAVWTGREVLVWSSAAPFESDRPSGEVVLAYDPANNRWRTLPASGLAPRFGAVVVWTGHELVVWGGSGPASTPYDDGARLDPATGTWRPLPAAPVPARANAAASWSGREVLLWGGRSAPGTDVGEGAAYNPTTNQWRALPASPLRARVYATSAWTGRVFIVVGGSEEGNLPVPGPGAAAYDPATDTWTALPPAPPYPVTYGPPFTADQRELANAVWTGSAMVVLGGRLLGQQAASPDGVVWTPAG